ncbi:MAG: ComF family protein [Clostridia bacterium]|nr:ComF family protein [Clostridia bacterium]
MTTQKSTIAKGKLKKGKISERQNVFGTCASMFVKLYHSACSVFFPSNIKCLICGDDLKEKQDIEICDACKFKLQFLSDTTTCARCGAPITGQGQYCLNCQNGDCEFDIARSVFVYEGEIRHLIAGLKYNNKPYLSRTLSQYIAEKYKELGWEADLIVPVPLSSARKKWRGYNQAELLAEGVSDVIGVPINTETLIKIKDTDAQATLNLSERRKNLRESFKVMDKYAVKGKRILLIDDVMTTGSTASACTHELKKAHASRVMVLSIAHAKTEIPTETTKNSAEILAN